MDKIKTSQFKRLNQLFNVSDKSIPFKKWVLMKREEPFFNAWLYADESLEEVYSTQEQLSAFDELCSELL